MASYGYTIVDRKDGILITAHPDYGTQIWSRSKITYRHNKDKCALCGMTVGNRGYRPLTNLSNRMYRFCSNH